MTADLMRRLAWLLVAALATARLTRFFTSDKLGEWVAVGPAKRWAFRQETAPEFRDQIEEVFERDRITGRPQETPNPMWGWRSKLVTGLDCPFCVGFWLGALVLLALPLTRVPVLGAVVRFGLSALALNYITGHVSAKLD